MTIKLIIELLFYTKLPDFYKKSHNLSSYFATAISSIRFPSTTKQPNLNELLYPSKNQIFNMKKSILRRILIKTVRVIIISTLSDM